MRGHPFDGTCWSHGIEYRLTKPDHPLAARGAVKFRDLLSERPIPVAAMREAMEAAAARQNLDFAPKYPVCSAGVAISLVQAGLGVTVTPECLVSRDLLGEVAVVGLDENWARRHILIATAQDRVPGRAASMLMAQLLDRPGTDR